METAIKVVKIYVEIVIPPIEESFDKSLRSETPLISEANINGTAINFNEFINMVPKGFIQFMIKLFPPSKFNSMRPNRTPRTIPKIICQ